MLLKPLCVSSCLRCNNNFIRTMCSLLKQERKLEVLTCKHLFPNQSEGVGLKFDVTYLDEELPDGTEKPVVLMLPGAPGGYKDFKEQIPVLVNSGARVIAPNFPELQDLLKYRSPKCRNTPENKSALIRDFLASIDISKVDMVVSHSSAVYTSLRLFRFPGNLDIRSLAMVNPLGHWHTTTRPAWLYWSIAEMVNYKIGYGFLNNFGKTILKILSPVEVPNIDAPLLGLASIRSFDLKEIRVGYDEVAKKKPPLLFMFSDNDRLIKKKVSLEMLDIFGSKKEDWWYYDENGKLVTKGKDGDWIRVLNFRKGSHYSLRKHSDLVSQAMADFLKVTLNGTTQKLTHRDDHEVSLKPTECYQESTICCPEKRQLSNQI